MTDVVISSPVVVTQSQCPALMRSTRPAAHVPSSRDIQTGACSYNFGFLPRGEVKRCGLGNLGFTLWRGGVASPNHCKVEETSALLCLKFLVGIARMGSYVYVALLAIDPIGHRWSWFMDVYIPRCWPSELTKSRSSSKRVMYSPIR